MGGHTYQAQIEVGFSELDQAGRFQLWAGAPDIGNEDNFPSSAVLLADLAVNSNTYTLGQWHPLSLTYTAPASGAALGQSLTVSFMTTAGSHGPTFWDNAALSVTAVPEPQAYLMMLLGLVLWQGWPGSGAPPLRFDPLRLSTGPPPCPQQPPAPAPAQ